MSFRFCVKLGRNFLNSFTVEKARLLRPIVESDHTDMNIRSSKNPFTVTLGKKDVARFFNSLERFAVSSATNPLRCQQSGPFALAIFYQLACLFKPVTAQICLWFDAVCEILKKGLNVGVSKLTAKEFSSQKRRIADDHVALR